ncbi:MAG: hypothetical protein EA402_09310 [Planctomycetota bacterium]|nr:MAG: hypothetical protein EA402_09310 [Planctomycetota bacterium]
MARYVTGIDIGNVSISAVCLRYQGAATKVVGHSSVSRLSDDGAPRPLALSLAELLKRCPVKGEMVLASSMVPVLIRYIPTIPMPPDRLQRLLRLELQQHADAENDLAADYFPVPLAGDEIIQCCCIAQVSALRQHLEELHALDLQPSAVQAPPLALGNVLALRPEEDNSQTFALLVDIGAKTTRLVLHQGGEMLAAREIAIGGDAFSEALARERDSDFASAESLKLNGGHLLSNAAPSPASPALNPSLPVEGTLPIGNEPDVSNPSNDSDPFDWLLGDEEPAPIRDTAENPETQQAGDEALLISQDAPTAIEPNPPTAEDGSAEEDALNLDDPAPRWQRLTGPVDTPPRPDLEQPGSSTVLLARSELGPEITRAAEQLAGQISSSVAWFRAQLKTSSITLTRIEICGGGARLEGLAHYLQRRLRSPIETIDPGQILGVAGLPPLALGCALSRRQGAVHIDLRPESLRRRLLWRQHILGIYIAAALLLLAAVVTIFAHRADRRHYQGEIARLDAHASEHLRASQQLEQLRRSREHLTTDVRGIAARIFAGRDLLYVIRSLKEAAERHQDLWVAEFRTESVASDSQNLPATGATAGARGATRGSTARGGGTAAPAHVDTSIDRGRIFVRVVIRRDAGRDAQAYERIFRDWLGAVMRWERPDNNQTLFSDYQQTEVPTVGDQLEYEVRFDFQPTVLVGGQP